MAYLKDGRELVFKYLREGCTYKEAIRYAKV